MAATLPMRFRILHIISQHNGIVDADIMEALKPEYGSEGQFRLSIVHNHLASMKAVGMIKDANISLDAQGALIQPFVITDYGRSRLAYLPKAWHQAA